MKSSLLAILLSASVAGSAWCQSAPKNAAELARYMSTDRERLLYDGAKKEGKVVWYTSLTIYKEMAKAFEARYPGVAVEPYRSTAVNLVSRILSEAQSKRYIVDVIETTPGSLMLVRDNKLLLPYNSPHLATYPENFERQGAWRFVLHQRGSGVVRRHWLQQERNIQCGRPENLG